MHLLNIILHKGSVLKDSLIVFLLMSYAIFMGTMFHASYVFLGTLMLNRELFNDFALFDKLHTFFIKYWFFLIIVAVIFALIATVFYIKLILSGKTLLKKWMFIINPIFIFAFLFLLIYIFPVFLQNFLFPTIANLTMVFYFIFLFIISNLLTPKNVPV